jgi:hypothetical protein
VISVLAQSVPEVFTATASVKRGGASASAPLAVTVTRYASAAEREALMAAVRDGGTAAVRTVLAGMSDAGFIRLGERSTPIKFAAQRPMPSGRLVTVVTAEPILFLGSSLPEAKPRTGYDVAVAMLDVADHQGGGGELVPAAKVGMDANGALLIDDYGATVVWLNDLVRAR